MAQQLTKRALEALIYLLTLSLYLVLVSCSIQLKIPDVVDDRVKALVRSEAAHVLMVSEDPENFSKYQFFLSDFQRQDLLGMSLGKRKNLHQLQTGGAGVDPYGLPMAAKTDGGS
ncbi:MAG TPA: hypothetical protein VKH62_06745 [Candidatus Binatia bacterium]|nr:hypothetical protein [Candidatus Binatia bacterium]